MLDQQGAPGGGGRVLVDATVQALRGRVRSELPRPGDEGYDGARTIHNGMIDRRRFCCSWMGTYTGPPR